MRSPRDYGEDRPKPWEASIQFHGASKGGRSISASSPNWTLDRRNAQAAAPGITVEYQNATNGLRQNFWVLSPPEGDEPLTLTFTVTSQQLGFKVENDEVLFSDKAGTDVFAYTDLNVWDANEQKLAASMVPLAGNRFAILVDDAPATYPIYVDPLTTSVKVYNESQSGAQFSYSLAMYLRFPEDGDTPGIIVGAPYFDTGSETDAGKVFVYYDFSTLPNSPTWTKEGDQSYAHFGWSVASPGDIDDNGYGDILIGAPHWDDAGGTYNDAGKAWLFSASVSGIDSTASWSYDIPYPDAQLGYAVSGVGDMNHDFISDFAVGAPGFQNTSVGDGKVFIFKGTSSGPVSQTSITGPSLSRLGSSLAQTGNIDDDIDLNDDFVAGAPNYNPGGGARGAAYVFFSNGSTYSSTIISGQNIGDKFGYSVAGPSDVNGDTYPDVLVGAPYHGNGQTAEGKIYLYTGMSSGINTTAYFTDESNEAHAHLGWSVAGSPFTGSLRACLKIRNGPVFRPDDGVEFVSSRYRPKLPRWFRLFRSPEPDGAGA